MNVSNYRRVRVPGGTYFFTVVTHERVGFLCCRAARHALRIAINKTRDAYPFQSIAWVLLPDHLHCLWRLPEGDAEYATRWRLIKRRFTQQTVGQALECGALSASRLSRGERGIWQRRFWEHAIRDQNDLHRHIDYIHFNPVKHGYVQQPSAWPYSTFNRYVSAGYYGERDLVQQELIEGTGYD